MTDWPFIERRFDSGQGPVVVRWYQPIIQPTGEYKCRWSIAWPDRERKSYSCGVDGVQALLLAMRIVHVELMESDLYKIEALTFLETNDLGLPPGWD